MSLHNTVQNVTHTSQPTYGRRRRAPRARVRVGRAALMALGVALALAAAVVAWGGRGESVRNREAADSALEQVGNLTSRVEALESELSASTTALSRAERVERSLADRLDRVTARLDKALGRVRKSTAAARAGAKSAAADSASALATAQDAARELNVLQERYDYHLRRYHGGG